MLDSYLVGQSMLARNTVFDIGMYDGSDTEYYLSEGYRVVAVEANPVLVERATRRFQQSISEHQLVIINAAIVRNTIDSVVLNLSGDDLGASSIDETWVSARNPIGRVRVPAMQISKMFQSHGIPFYLKVDIEGADGQCVLSLTKDTKSNYISFEAGEDLGELIEHLQTIGYRDFRAVNQINFFDLNNDNSLMLRARQKIVYLLGYKEPKYVKKNGRFFLSGHSSGPFPWTRKGHWFSARELLRIWNLHIANHGSNIWYDIHAR